MKTLLLLSILLFALSNTICAQNNKNAGTPAVINALEINSSSLLDDLLNNSFEIDPLDEKLIITNLENTDLFEDITVSPNPSSDKISFEIPETYTYIDVKIFDAQAKQLLHHRKTMGIQSIDLHNLPVGMYFMQIISQDKVHRKTLKIIKN